MPIYGTMKILMSAWRPGRFIVSINGEYHASFDFIELQRWLTGYDQ